MVESAGATVDELDARLEQLPFQIDEAQALLVSREQEAERLQTPPMLGARRRLIIAKAPPRIRRRSSNTRRQDAVLRARERGPHRT